MLCVNKLRVIHEKVLDFNFFPYFKKLIEFCCYFTHILVFEPFPKFFYLIIIFFPDFRHGFLMCHLHKIFYGGLIVSLLINIRLLFLVVFLKFLLQFFSSFLFFSYSQQCLLILLLIVTE